MNKSRKQDLADELDDIFQGDAPEIEKLRDAFGSITALIVEQAQHQVELLRAVPDRESVVKTQIKMETIKTARSIFDTCYTRITGRKAWDEQEGR